MRWSVVAGRVRRAGRAAGAPEPVRRVLPLAAAASVLGAAVTTVWVAVSVRRRPRGHDVVEQMAYREQCPEPRPAVEGRTPVVLVHGLGMSGKSMDRLVRALGQTTRTLAPDLPGYGRSPSPRGGQLGITALGRAVLSWMDDVGVDEVVLVGHSLGAQVAAEVALMRPDRVRRLVMIAPTGDPQRPSVLRQALRLLRGATSEPPQLVVIAALDYVRAGPGQMVALMHRAMRRARHNLDATLEVPLLVVRGADDLVCSQDWCERLVASAPGSRLVVVPGAAHGVAFEAPAVLVDALREEVAAAGRVAEPGS